MKSNIATIIVVSVAVGGLGFFGGMKYQESKTPAGVRQFAGGPNGFGANRQGRNGSQAGRPVAGEILNADEKSITVKLQDGSSKIVLITDKTSINKATAGTKVDLTAGQRVAAFGTENPDGSVTAVNIQLNPQFGRIGEDTPKQGQ